MGYLWHLDRQILQEEPRNKNINIFFLSFQGGVVGYATTTHGKETQQAVIGFDMGGTSTGNHFRWLFTTGQTLLILKNMSFLDVSRFDGSYEHVFETTTAGVTIQAPQLDVSTVAGKKKNLLEIHFDEIFCD